MKKLLYQFLCVTLGVVIAHCAIATEKKITLADLEQLIAKAQERADDDRRRMTATQNQLTNFDKDPSQYSLSFEEQVKIRQKLSNEVIAARRDAAQSKKQLGQLKQQKEALPQQRHTASPASGAPKM